MNDLSIRFALATVLLGGLPGCGGKKVDLGTDNASLEAPDAGDGEDYALDPEECTALEDLRRESRADDLRQPMPVIPTGLWQGGIREPFSEESVDIALTLNEDGSGSVLLGEAAEPFVPRDEKEVYLDGGHVGLQEGFPYTLHAMQLEGGDLRFRLHPHEIYREWCAAQTAHERISCEYRCLPSSSGFFDFEADTCEIDVDGEPPMKVDCKSMYLCALEHACFCLSTGCEYSTGSVREFNGTYDAVAGTLSGTFNDTRGTVTFAWVSSP